MKIFKHTYQPNWGEAVVTYLHIEEDPKREGMLKMAVKKANGRHQSTFYGKDSQLYIKALIEQSEEVA